MGKTAIIGLGLTGVSAVHYLQQRGESIIALDTRAAPAGVEELQQQYPDMPIYLGSLDSLLAESVDRVVVSPGVPLEEPVLQAMRRKNIPIFSDIDLFLESNQIPVVAITGSNGKTTVTTWVGECLKSLGYRVNVCGNIGAPVLSDIGTDVDFVVMELSSFQLDASHAINADVAICLNISPDHLDRHGNLENYTAAKMRVYKGAKTAIVHPGSGYEYVGEPGQAVEPFLMLPNLGNQTKQDVENAAATVTILVALGIQQADAVAALTHCKGLPHRFQTVATVDGVVYINDSKATNIGAAMTAMQAAKQQSKRVILIAGGQSKATPLDEWASAVKETAAVVFLYGEDARLMQLALKQVSKEAVIVSNLKEAVEKSQQSATFGDSVLLAPATASFDMFTGYEQRGDVFMACVSLLPGKRTP